MTSADVDARITETSLRRLSVMFVMTTLHHGGAETLLVNLIRRLDRARFAPELCCLKTLGPLGDQLSAEVPTTAFNTRSKYDIRILGKLTRHFHDRRIDAVVTVGAGDKMFWGRLAAWRARVPLVISALHTTGWPDCVGRLNRMLTPLNDAFVGVAQGHGEHLVQQERLPPQKVHVIPNGVDVDRFCPGPGDVALRRGLGLPESGPIVGIVARLGEEKNHDMFLKVAARVRRSVPGVRFVSIGDGPRRGALESMTVELGLEDCVHFLGVREDIPQLLRLLDVFVLTSHVEANPVSVLEALASGKPVVATRVGSVPETVIDGHTGHLVEPGDTNAMANRVTELLQHPTYTRQLGRAARAHITRHWSLERMVQGYEELIGDLYEAKLTASSAVPAA